MSKPVRVKPLRQRTSKAGTTRTETRRPPHDGQRGARSNGLPGTQIVGTVKPPRSRRHKGNGAREVPELNRSKPGSAGTRHDWPARRLDNVELFDDEGLAESIASITGNSPESADELTLHLLIILDAAGETAPESVRRTIEQSVRLAFQSTETLAAALELYILGQRGLLSGPLPRDSILEIMTSRGLKDGDGTRINADEKLNDSRIGNSRIENQNADEH
jgi:hypothetical protein